MIIALDSKFEEHLWPLTKGKFAIPDFHWKLDPGGLSQVSGEGSRAMMTMLKARGFSEHIHALVGDRIFHNDKLFNREAFNALERSILKRIDSCITNLENGGSMSDSELTTIVCGIHIWGGRTGRNVFVRDLGFHDNFSLPAYRKIIDAIIRADETSAVEAWQTGDFKHIGTAYATKHLAFWTKTREDFIKLPILDSIIGGIVFGNKTPSFRIYPEYLYKMKASADIINQLNPDFQGRYNVHHLERQLFDWAGKNDTKFKKWWEIRVR